MCIRSPWDGSSFSRGLLVSFPDLSVDIKSSYQVSKSQPGDCFIVFDNAPGYILFNILIQFRQKSYLKPVFEVCSNPRRGLSCVFLVLSGEQLTYGLAGCS